MPAQSNRFRRSGAKLMPITQDNCERFYQGHCAELHVASLFYFAGYEAQKSSPDIGVDLIVTNLARERFNNESQRAAQVQVKSALMDSKGASVAIPEDELDFLCNSDDRYCVFVLFHELWKRPDNDSFNFYVDQVDKNIDLDVANFDEQQVAKSGRALLASGNLSIHDFSGYRATVFWLNSKQMNRAKAEGLWVKREADYKISIQVREGAIYLGDTRLVPELSEVRYIMRAAKSDVEFRAGKFSLDHA